MAKALAEFAEKYPDVSLTYVYNELNNYTTSASVSTDNAADAVRKIVGRNPVMVVEKKGHIYVESYQKGKYLLTGRVVNEHGEGVPYANVMVLSPRDSVVMTYGITTPEGGFSIPCDKLGVLAKISSTGYKTRILTCRNADLGNVLLETLAVDLGELNVVGEQMHLMSDRTVYIPLQRQKNTAMTGIELIERMAIPQVSINPNSGKLETNTGKPVELYIDNLPASSEDLAAMNMQDVKRVEFLEFPSDPRFGGNPYVVNFIMVKYEYGGYTKLFATENFIMNSGNLQPSSRFQYKNMTYDLMLLPFYLNNDHYGEEKTETFRLPQPDGGIKTFTRQSDTRSSHKTRQQYIAVFKATYKSDNLTIANTLNGMIDNQPHTDETGSVVYTPADFPASDYSSFLCDRSKTISYKGDFYLKLNEVSSLTFNPQYSFSHTVRNSTYLEKDFEPVFNGARDNANGLSGRLQYSGKVREGSSVTAFASGNYNYYRTRYSGSATSLDKSKDVRLSVGASYDLSVGKLYGYLSLGWNWDRLRMNGQREYDNSPFGNLSLQYLFNNRNRLSFSANYSEWSPSASFKSSNVITSNHLMSYTGNPNLVPSKIFGFDLSYLLKLSSKLSLTAFVASQNVKDRYVYDYEPTSQGIIRTIKQPMGDYSIGNYGISARLALLGNKLFFTGNLTHDYAYNGKPYDYTRWKLRYSAKADYYMGDFYFSGSYSSRSAYSDGYMVGTWMEYKDFYKISIGWANSKFNVKATANNFARWNWRSHKAWFDSPYYDSHSVVSDISCHAYFSLSVTYTFNYGKKVSSEGAPSSSGSSDSGILKQ